MTIAPWLQRHLENAGLWNADGISLKPRTRPCRHCGTLTLVALAGGRVAAWPATCDLAPLSNLGEAIALLAGTPTWHLGQYAGRLELDPRDQSRIRGLPADDQGDYDVLASHVCGVTYAGPLTRETHLKAPATEVRIPAGAPPPF